MSHALLTRESRMRHTAFVRCLSYMCAHFYFTLSRIHHRGVTHLHVVCGAATQHTTCERRAALMIMLGHTRSSSHSFDGVVVMISLAPTTVIESRGDSSRTGAARGLSKSGRHVAHDCATLSCRRRRFAQVRTCRAEQACAAQKAAARARGTSTSWRTVASRSRSSKEVDVERGRPLV